MIGLEWDLRDAAFLTGSQIDGSAAGPGTIHNFNRWNVAVAYLLISKQQERLIKKSNLSSLYFDSFAIVALLKTRMLF